MAKNLVQFFREVRQESSKVTWPSRSEVVTTTIVVLIMVTVAGLVLLAADWAIAGTVQFILGTGK